MMEHDVTLPRISFHKIDCIVVVLVFLVFSSVFACHFTNSDNHSSVIYSRTCNSKCEINFKGNCRCYIIRNETSAATSGQIRLECLGTNAQNLMIDIDHLSSCNLSLAELYVKNSNLNHLYNLPSGLYNIQKLVLDNTGIDLETIRESHELLKSLKILRISNENFTEIPETLFNGMDELEELSLNNLGISGISVDAFVSLQDSLTLLELRLNKIRTIPNAIQLLSYLECLDLSDNDIKTLSDGHTAFLSAGLKRLKQLRINPMRCTCEFGKNKFATWLRTHAIRGVTCSVPDRLIEKDVSNTPIEEFCEPLSGSANISVPLLVSTFICLLSMSVTFIQIKCHYLIYYFCVFVCINFFTSLYLTLSGLQGYVECQICLG